MVRLIPWLIVLSCVVGCKKKTKITHPVDAETKSHFSFKVGTYWIYRDSATGIVDSFQVSSTGSAPEPDGTEYFATFINIYNDTDEAVLGIHLHNNHIQYKFVYSQEGCSFDYPYWSSGKLLPTFSLNGNTYDSVLVQGGSGTYYVRHDIGMIKMIVETDSYNKVWELVRYKIVK